MKKLFLIGLVFLSVGLSAQISLLPKKNRVAVFQSGVTISYDSFKQSAEGEDLINSTDTLLYVSGTGTDQIFDLSSLEDTRWNKNAYIGNAFALPEYYDFPYLTEIYYDAANPYHWKIKDFHYRYYEEQADALTNIAFAKLTYSGGVLQSSDELLLYNTEQTGTDLADIKSYIGFIDSNFGGHYNNEFDLTSGLVAFYPFNGNANDESDNTNNGSINGAVLTNDRNDTPNSAYEFDGVNDYIQVAYDTSLAPYDISISFWFKASDFEGTQTMTMISRYFLNYEFAILDWSKDKSVQNQLFYKSDGIGSYEFDDLLNQSYNNLGWNNIVFTFNSVTKIFTYYLNGDNKGTTLMASSSLYSDAKDLFIGSRQGTENFTKGILDDIRIYNRILSDYEVGLLSE